MLIYGRCDQVEHGGSFRCRWVAALASLLGIFLFALSAFGVTKTSPKRVLIIDSFGHDVAPFNALASAFRTTLRREIAEPLDINEASLDTARFMGPQEQGTFVDFLEKRFAGRKLDLVVPISFPALSFAGRYRERLLPEAPMLIAGIDQRRLRPEFLSGNTTVITKNVNLPRIVEDILQVLPETKNIVVMFGASPLEKFWLAECQREFQRFANRVSFTWFNELSCGSTSRASSAMS
jgi:hypothetical protein